MPDRIRQVKKQCKGQSGQRVWSDFNLCESSLYGKLSPAALSAQFGYHEAYFCRRFRELTGITFSEYVRALRMEYAQKLLKESEDEVGTVAWKCGYPDGSYFTREFRKMYGFTPSQFRRMAR